MSKRRNIRTSIGERELGLITYSFRDGIMKGTKRGLEEIAPHLLEEIVEQEAEFNNYTGNLEEAYAAVVISNGVKSKVFFHDVDRKGRIVTGKKGGRKVYISRVRHGIKRWGMNRDYKGRIIPAFRGYRNGVWYDSPERGRGVHKFRRKETQDEPRDYRYMKKWESKRGYRSRAGKLREAGYMAGKKRSFIRIMNLAPYAPYLQYGKNRSIHYNVLRGAPLNLYGQMFKNILLDELQKKGFRAPKYKLKKR